VALLLTALAAGCSGEKTDQVQFPARVLYLEAQALEDQGLFTDAIEKFQRMATENRGTRLGALAYLRLAELYFRQKDWLQAETNYRLFLTANPSSNLNAYVLSRLIKVNHEKSYTGIFFPAREIDRDMEPNRKIALEYKRFYLLYPKSTYLEETATFHRAAIETLAQHEQMVGDYYFKRHQYNAAAYRYFLLLRNYPSQVDTRDVLGRLIESYRANQQPGLAGEMQRIYDERFGEKSAAADSPRGAAPSATAPPESASLSPADRGR
jgi:outer membrane protein assembly factor BamD